MRSKKCSVICFVSSFYCIYVMSLEIISNLHSFFKTEVGNYKEKIRIIQWMRFKSEPKLLGRIRTMVKEGHSAY